MFGSGFAFVNEIEDCEKQQRFVGPLVAFVCHADDADVEIVEAFDGFIQCHRDREAKETTGGKGNR